jgi:hypothetical protein
LIKDLINSISREFANNRFLTLFLLMEDHKHGIWGKNSISCTTFEPFVVHLKYNR